MIQNILALIINFLKLKITTFSVPVWSRSRLFLLGAGADPNTEPETEPPKKVAAPQHWFELL